MQAFLWIAGVGWVAAGVLNAACYAAVRLYAGDGIANLYTHLEGRA